MGHLPVQDGADLAVAVEEEIAGAIVAMDDAEFLGRRRRIAPEPADRRQRDRLRFQRIFTDHLLPTLEFVPPAIRSRACAVQIAKADGVRVRAGDAAENVPELRADLVAMGAIGIGGQDRGDRAVLDLLHDEEGPLERAAVQFERDRFRHGKAKAVKRLIGAELCRAFGLDQAGFGIASEDQRAIARSGRFRYSARGSDRSDGSPRPECAPAPRS